MLPNPLHIHFFQASQIPGSAPAIAYHVECCQMLLGSRQSSNTTFYIVSSVYVLLRAKRRQHLSFDGLCDIQIDLARGCHWTQPKMKVSM